RPPRPRTRRARRHAHRAAHGGRQPRRAGIRRRAARARRACARDPPADRAAGDGAAPRHAHGHAHGGAARARARGLRRRRARDRVPAMTDTATLAAWDRRHLWHPFTQMADWLAEEPLVIAEAEGTTLVDTRGRRYLDGVSSLWCNVHGHRHPALDAALGAQLARVAHSTLLGLANVPSIELARALVEVVPPGLTRVFYSDAGATAVEPLVQGAAGMWVHPPAYLRALHDLAHRHGTLLIADEVATGFGRTGRMFACEHAGITPDLMCLAKGISGGYLPLAATLATEEV